MCNEFNDVHGRDRLAILCNTLAPMLRQPALQAFEGKEGRGGQAWKGNSEGHHSPFPLFARFACSLLYRARSFHTLSLPFGRVQRRLMFALC